jgi:P4 family phage/plasmid primase-like protien
MDEVVLGLDLDECLDEDDALRDWARPFLAAAASYTERSPGGRGLKTIGRVRTDDLAQVRRLLGLAAGENGRTRQFGERVPGGHVPNVQLFLGDRYFAITGQHWTPSPEEVCVLSLGQVATLAALFGSPKRPAGSGNGARNGDETVPDDAAVHERLGVAFVGNPRLRERWEGGTEGLADATRSGRDMSIVAMLIAAGFSKGETRVALQLFAHGKMREEEDADAGERYFDRMWERSKATPPPSTPGTSTAPPASVIGWVSPTEDAVALAFAAHHQGCLVYDHTEECWFIWNGTRWLRDLRNRVFNDARELTRAVRDTLNKTRAPLAKIAFVAAVERACRADPRLAVDFSVWNRDTHLLGTPNTAVDTTTGASFPPNPTRYISRHTAVVPAPPGTPAPIWDAFLDEATRGDKEFQGFIHRAGGYMLTGDVSEEVLFFFYGPGGNGKGTILSVLMGILGDYALSVPIEVFTAASRVNLEYYRAQMAGARLVTASETEQQAVWSETLIKDLTGNDSLLSGRHPYGKPFTFRPQAKLLIIGNYAPKLRHRSPAMERRLRVTPFLNVPARPDPELKEKLKAEYPAILRKLIDGCLEWRQHRLGMPAAIKEATDSYFEQQDAFRRWLDECCTLLEQFTTKTGILLADFNAWARSNGEDEVSGKAFAELLDRTPGLRRIREAKTGNRMTKGIALKPPANYGQDVPDMDPRFGEQRD